MASVKESTSTERISILEYSEEHQPQPTAVTTTSKGIFKSESQASYPLSIFQPPNTAFDVDAETTSCFWDDASLVDCRIHMEHTTTATEAPPAASRCPLAPLDMKELDMRLKVSVADSKTQVPDNAFFGFLNKEVQRVNERFLKLAKTAAREHGNKHAHVASRTWLRHAVSLKHLRSLWSPTSRDARGPCLAHACSEYAENNTRLLRKILMKYDETSGSKLGAAYERKLWKDQSGAAAFLHSPTRVQIDTINCIESLGEFDRLRSQLGPQFRMTLSDFTCPICLDVLYRPVVLSCGHTYCLPCLLETCQLGKAVGTVRALMSNIPESAPCSKCRQRGVYRTAAIINEVETFVRLQYPEEWRIRDQEEKRILQAKKTKLREQDRISRPQNFGRFHPCLLLQ